MGSEKINRVVYRDLGFSRQKTVSVLSLDPEEWILRTHCSETPRNLVKEIQWRGSLLHVIWWTVVFDVFPYPVLNRSVLSEPSVLLTVKPIPLVRLSCKWNFLVQDWYSWYNRRRHLYDLGLGCTSLWGLSVILHIYLHPVSLFICFQDFGDTDKNETLLISRNVNPLLNYN